MGDRIARFFHIGRQWLTAAPRYRGTVICGLSAIAAMIAIGFNGNKGTSPPSAPVVQTGNAVPAPDSAKPSELFATRNAARSLDLARPAALADRKASDPGAIDPRNLPRVIALDRSFLVGDTGNENAAIRDEDEGKKTANNSAKKPPRRVKSGDRDRGFSPSREIRRASEKITRVIRRNL